MANKRNQFSFQPILLDQDTHVKRRVIQQLPAVHQTETLQKFFGATVDHLFDPGQGKPINGYVGQKPMWYDPDQDYYLTEPTDEREFYQLEASMVSKNTEGVITDVLPYVDLINQLRFQGALVDNHDRLFRQDFYTWCPPIDLDKIINFRQYVWLPYDVPTIQLTGPTITYVATGNSTIFDLPGYGTNADVELATYYDTTLLTSDLIIVTVDGVAKPFTYVAGSTQITFAQSPAADAVVNISVYSDLENNAIGLPLAHAKAFGGVTLSSNMRVTVVLDYNTDFKNTKTYIVEEVGRSIELIEEVGTTLTSPDYLTMGRGAINKNEWSTANRWFHTSVLPSNIDPAYLTARKATRPIIEFDRDLELYNYGLRRRLDVDLVVENIADLNGYMNLNPTDITIDSVRFVVQNDGTFSVESTDTSVQLGYGNVDSVRLMIRNTSNTLLNNNILVLVTDSGNFKLVLETDGSDPSGLPVFGEMFKVNLGTYSSNNLHWDGTNWVVSQNKTSINQSPLFELYDLNQNSLRDTGLYPGSTFQGNKLFSYQVDTTGTSLSDVVLGMPLVYDNQGQILFQNYLRTDAYQYVVGGNFLDITGYYFHKTDNLVTDLISYSDDWFLAPLKTQQLVVDRYVSDGRTRLFTMSQIPTSLTVTRGRVTTGSTYQSVLLVEDVDFIRIDDKIMMLNIQKGDVIEIRTYSPNSPTVGSTGQYEVPLNLQANPDNSEVSFLTKGDFYDHFSEIMKKQPGFIGAEYASNNYRDTLRETTLGTHIVQHSAPLLKTMLLASNQQLDLVAAMRYSELEYLRFKDKFQKKILSYVSANKFNTSVSYDVWINTALGELNKGKTNSFPFYLSGMAQSTTYQLPTFIPATPSFLGVYPLFSPTVFSQAVFDSQGNSAPIWFVKGHDGSLTAADNEMCAQVLQALEMRIFNSIPANIRAEERPSCDWLDVYGDQFRTNDYSYDEFLTVLRRPFERWTVAYRRDATINTTYQKNDPWTWNWSTIPTSSGSLVPGHWRGIYEKFFGTQRPDLTPWESLGFTIKPSWWDGRYGIAPYTSDNSILWNDIENGFIFAGPRAGVNAALARPGLTTYIPVDIRGRLRHPGPRSLIALSTPGPDLMFLGENQPDSYYVDWEDTHDEGVLGCNICPFLPLVNARSGEWTWGDIGPVEQDWRRSSAYSFAIALASYLMKPSKFVELGWNTKDSVLFFKGTIDEQWLDQDTKGRPSNQDLQIHGEVLADLTVVTKVGIQQWVSDMLSSRNTDITVNFADKIRGLGSQLTYKVGGFTDSTTLIPVSDAFGRVPSEDVTVALYRSPSIREESYSGVAIEIVPNGYEIQGYDVLNPTFTVIPPSTTSARTLVGSGAAAALVPIWRPNTYYQVNITVRNGDNFFTALKTHTSSVYFETAYWTQVARPQYADGTSLAWYQESDLDALPVSIPYGTVLKKPQDVADFLNGYERYLTSRGWSFANVNDSNTDIKDWKSALGSFVIWSSASVRQIGDFLALSPSSSLIQFTTDQGSIQPIEQLINGLYAITDAQGQPIDPSITSVVRSDGNVAVSCNSLAVGIFGLRLYISEIEHILVFNNTTIFNNTIYNPLLNIKQPRLRIQGFKTTNWKGRIDAPGFIVTGDTLTPNFERSADDFRRFFDIESMENKNLQDRARANFGYMEKDYLDNLLLTPTNQFEFYQGMIQQKGSPTSMNRLLRSNFIRNNNGLQLFEEWAFRIGNYGGQDAQPSLDIQIRQSEFNHNPQLIEFDTTVLGEASNNNWALFDQSDVSRTNTISRFDGRYWNVNFSNPMMASVTTTLASELLFSSVSYKKNDLAGLIWDSTDILDHVLFSYETNLDYSNCQLSFDWESNNIINLSDNNGPVLTIEGLDTNNNPQTWYVRLFNYIVPGTTASIHLDFNTLDAGFSLPTDASRVNPTNISRMFISLASTGYTGEDLPLSSPVESWVKITNIVTTGTNRSLAIANGVVDAHQLQMATGFDDSYNITPWRMVYNLYGLGYRGSINHYVGMGHYFKLLWNGSTFLVDSTNGFLNTPCVIWHTSLSEACNILGYDLILSMSYELLDQYVDEDWKQRAEDGSPALTGWSPPSTLLSPANPAAMSYLTSVAIEFMRTFKSDSSIKVTFQIGEPWWWTNAGKIYMYDSNAVALLGPNLVSIPDIRVTLDDSQTTMLDLAGTILANSTFAIRDAIKLNFPNTDIAILTYLPTVLDSSTPEVIRANVPVEWAYPAFDILQIEDYDWVTSGRYDLTTAGIATMNNRLAYPIAAQQYISGFILDNSQSALWSNINLAADNAVELGFSKVFVWALPQVIRDGFVHYLPQFLENEKQKYHIVINDTANSDLSINSYDDHWSWRPDTLSITWPTRDSFTTNTIPDTAGCVNLDEVRFTVPTDASFADFYNAQITNGITVEDRDRVWVYGLDSSLPANESWSTHKFNFTGYTLLNSFTSTYQGQGAIVQIDSPLKTLDRSATVIDGRPVDNLYFVSQPLFDQPTIDYVHNGILPLSNEKLIIKDPNSILRTTYMPKTANVVSTLMSGGSTSTIMGFTPTAGQFVRRIYVTVTNAFPSGSTLTVGYSTTPDYFIGLKTEPVRDIQPALYTDETILVQTPSTTYVADNVTDAPIDLVRVGTVSNFCADSTVTWTWVPASGPTTTGSVSFMRPSDYSAATNLADAYLQTITVPTTGDTTTGTLSVYLNGSPTASDTQTINIVTASASGQSFVDLTVSSTQPQIFDNLFYPDVFPWNTSGAPTGDDMIATLYNSGVGGNVKIDVEYYYTQGFELFDTSEGTLYPSVLTDSVISSQLYTWMQTRYTTLTDIVDYHNALNLWDNGDVVEIAPLSLSDAWQVYTFDSTYSGSTAPWKMIRQKNRKVNSDLLTNAAIFNSNENVLKMVLQLYDPLKGYIPGIADRELDYKLKSDPAVYNTGLMVWGKEHVAKLWWDLSSVRYLDYEIYDDLNGSVNYRWKNWGRVAPNTTVDIYEWVRSPVLPAQWNDYVASKAALQVDNLPTGTATILTNYVTETEWDDAIGAEELVYYFWVLNPTVTPTVESRSLSAQQVSNIILNPSSNDIPFFAVVDTNKVLVGGIKQFLNETDTVLKIKWTRDTEIVSNHHKQWIILREQDERNTIPDSLWNKMRDSLVGWDATQAYVPNPNLPIPQQVGAMIRPRQSWFPADASPTGGIRPNRSAREAFVETVNDILSAAPFVDQWTGWDAVFNNRDPLPTSDQYVTTALDLVDLNNLLPVSQNMVQPGQCVLVQSTAEVSGFWTLWKLNEAQDGTRTFILEDFQKWRMQEGELWNLADWYSDGWSSNNFPNYRFATASDLNASGNIDVTLLQGTLVQVDNTDTDNRWTWDVYTKTSTYQVAKSRATMALGSTFYDDTRVEFGPTQINDILSTSVDQRITTARIQELANLINNRDGSQEIEIILNAFRTTLFSILQKNSLFFSMVKSSLKQSYVVDWAFKTSFLYLGGYEETLQQSPIAFTDQINNVISYLEEVKPYHVTIREYVQRLSYGPDLANISMTDFDKPVYPSGSINRTLDVTNLTDQTIMAQRRPWKDWYSNYLNGVENIAAWDLNWNGVRRMKTTIKFDRVSCGSSSGWDTSPWDTPLLVYSQINGTPNSLSQLSELYRTANTGNNSNFYNDQAVNTIVDRNLLVRNDDVITGTIVTVLQDNTQFMWSGSDWIEFEIIGWDQDPDMGAATRIASSYLPDLGMKRKDDPGLIAGCEFDGTVIRGTFVNDLWDVFEWDSVGFDMGLSYITGVDYDSIDGNTTPTDESDPAYIAITGNQFSQPARDSGRPPELVNARGIENLVFNVTRSGVFTFKQVVDARGNLQITNADLSGITFVNWDQTSRSIALTVPSWSEDTNGFTPLHDPMNPSTGFIRDILLAKGYRSTSNVDMTSAGTKTFKLRDLGDVVGIPAGLMGNNVKVAVVNTSNPSIRAIGTLTNTKGSEALWNGSIQVTFDTGFVNLGSSKSWNIIPVDMFNEPGIVWIDDARFTYTGLSVTGTSVVLSNVKLSGSSLNPLTITENAADNTHTSPYNTVVLKSTAMVIDGSKIRQVA